MPTPLVGGIIFLCAAPFILNLFGIHFGSELRSLDLSQAASLNSPETERLMFQALSGAFHHTLFGWSAFFAAIFTVILAFTYYGATREITTPIIAIALLCSGCMDAFQTLAANHLISVAGDLRNLIPFAWAISQLFNALILIGGVSLFLSGRKFLALEGETGGLAFVSIASGAFGIIAYLAIHICATSERLPETQFTGSWITRPWDIAPLILYFFAGLILLPRFYKKHPSVFSYALIVSMIPQVVTQIHMAFGSSALYDNNFNIANFLKIVSYLVPMAGLILDYVRIYAEAGQRASSLEAAISALEKNKAAAETSKAQAEQVLRQTQAGREELKKANQEMRRINRAAIGREERMVELKKTINQLSKELNKPAPFESLDGEHEEPDSKQ